MIYIISLTDLLELTWVIYFYFLFLFIYFFTIQYWIDWELKFMICFDLFFIELSQSYDSNHKFYGLIKIDVEQLNISCFNI